MEAFTAATIDFLTSLSEADLQSTIIEPLLRLKGYTHVRDTSGPNDKGKDLVAILQEFGKTKLYAIQVKKLRFSGKHSSPRALTHVLTQLRQVFGEPVIDPTVGEKRYADRCLFVTPYPINQSALESALHQVKEFERREITIVDGPLLADMVLKYMPGIVARSSIEFQYRMAIAQYTSKIRESAAFGLSTMIELDNIYVELVLMPGEEGLEELSLFPAKLRKGQLLKASIREINELRSGCQLWNAPLSLVSDVHRPSAQERKRKDLKMANTIRLYHEIDIERAREDLPRDELRVYEVDLDQLIDRMKSEAEAYMRDYLAIGDDKVDNIACTHTVRKGIELAGKISILKRSDLVQRYWPEFTEKSVTDQSMAPIRLSASAILKVDLCTFVTGAPGAGKTTLLRRLSQRMAKSNVGQLPILVHLIDLQGISDYDVLNYSLRQMHAQGYHISEDELRRGLREGKYRGFFDGLDEAGTNADYLLGCIRSFCDLYPKCPVVITSRETLREKLWSDALHIGETRQ